MSPNSSIFRKRWPALVAVAVFLAVALAAGSMFIVNDRAQPVQEVTAEQLQPDLTDPGLYADPPAPAAAISEPNGPSLPPAPEPAVAEPNHPDAGVNQVVPKGSGALADWMADRPDEMGPFGSLEILAADDLDVEWMLYQAVEKDVMTQAAADVFRTWFDQRPSFDEAPELLNLPPSHIERPGDGTGGSIKSY